MFKLRPMGAVMTVQMPYRNDDVPMDMVAVAINKHSWRVDLKYAGRLSGSGISGAGGEASDDSRAVGGFSPTLISGTAVSGTKSTMARRQVLREGTGRKKEMGVLNIRSE